MRAVARSWKNCNLASQRRTQQWVWMEAILLSRGFSPQMSSRATHTHTHTQRERERERERGIDKGFKREDKRVT